MGHGAEPVAWVGRTEQIGRLRKSVRAAAAGNGGSLLVAGDLGGGKTALLSVAAEEAARLGCRVLHGTAEELGRSFPLRAVLDCFPAAGAAYDARRTAIVDLLAEPGATGEGRVTAAMERLAELVTRMCEESPVVLVLDDLHWADEASLLVWQRLARSAGRLPLLLLAARSDIPGTDTPRPRDHPATVVLRLGPMTGQETARMSEALLGAPAGPRLADRLRLADGNPRCLRELIDALLGGGRIAIANGTAELVAPAAADDASPVAVPAVIERLGRLTAGTRDALRMAALLGTEFSAAELAAVLDRRPRDLLRETDEALGAGLLADTGERLRFRQELVRETLRASMPRSVRSALHQQVARSLAESGAGPERVAEQLLPAVDALDGWSLRWLVAGVEELSARAPAMALELIRRAIDRLAHDDPDRDFLTEKLAAVACLLRCPDSVALIRAFRERATDPGRRAALTFLLAETLLTGSDAPGALVTVDEALAAAPVSPLWTARLLGLHGLVLWRLGRREEAAGLAERVVGSGDALAGAYGRHVLHLALARQHRYEDALAQIELGLAGLGAAAEQVEMRFRLLAGRWVVLWRLNRPDDVRQSIGQARELARRTGNNVQLAVSAGASAVLNYWTGDWDATLSDLRELTADSTDPGVPLRLHGLSALVLVHRDQREEARAHLAAAEELRVGPGTHRDPSGALLMARALHAERDGRPGEALAVLLPTLDAQHAEDLASRFMWFPDIVRLALEAGDSAAALEAVAVAATEAQQNLAHPERAAAAARCRGLWEREPELLRQAVAFYENAPRPLLLGQALEDLAVASAWQGDLDSARQSLNRAVDVYQPLGAAWDIARADARLRSLGVRRGRRTARRRTATGWGALTPTELKVARLVAEGRSNPEIATELFLSRRTVQTHVSHILAKLAVRSRTEVAREAAKHLPAG